MLPKLYFSSARLSAILPGEPKPPCQLAAFFTPFPDLGQQFHTDENRYGQWFQSLPGGFPPYRQRGAAAFAGLFQAISEYSVAKTPLCGGFRQFGQPFSGLSFLYCGNENRQLPGRYPERAHSGICIVECGCFFRHPHSGKQGGGHSGGFCGQPLAVVHQRPFWRERPLFVCASRIGSHFLLWIQCEYGNIPALHIAAVSLALNAIPAMAVLALSGFFQLPFSGAAVWKALGASFLLGAGGTALATILFYLLMKRAGNIFASLVTYGIPFVATGWGLVFGEKVTGKQIICLLIILSGVFMVNYAPSRNRHTAGNSEGA
jgi:hypothetical protein